MKSIRVAFNAGDQTHKQSATQGDSPQHTREKKREREREFIDERRDYRYLPRIDRLRLYRQKFT